MLNDTRGVKPGAQLRAQVAGPGQARAKWCPIRTCFRRSTTSCGGTWPSEIESFVASVLLEDRNVGDLLTADYTFLNERLARHYGITSVLRTAVPPRDAR